MRKRKKKSKLSFKEEVYSSLTPNSVLLGMLREHEGCSLSLYKDTVDKTTVGYGHNIEDRGISIATAEFMLIEDTREAMKDAQESLGDAYTLLSLNRKWVIVDMVFNMGAKRFKTFKKLIKALAEQDFNKASKEMLDSKWASQVGKRAVKLAKLMRNG
jgi:lysozyme